MIRRKPRWQRLRASANFRRRLFATEITVSLDDPDLTPKERSFVEWHEAEHRARDKATLLTLDILNGYLVDL